MKLIVLGDTHHRTENLERILPVLNDTDIVVHLGDYTEDMDAFRDRIKADIKIVRGNCDLFSKYPAIEFISAGNEKLMFIHGNGYGVKSGSPARLLPLAKENGCTFVFYGHAHAADTTRLEDITFINPGSLSRPRRGKPAYCLASLTADGFLKTEIVTL